MAQWFGLSAIVILALAGLYLLVKDKRPPVAADKLPYRRRELLSGSEQKAFALLSEALQLLGGSHVLLAKVRLSELLAVDTAADDAHHWHHELDTRVLDFLICSAGDLRPLLAVETTGDEHDFLSRALGGPDIKLLHLDAGQTAAALKQTLKSQLG